MEKWNELCYNLSENISANLSEDLFELKVIQSLDILGWKGFKGDLKIRSSFQVGASKRLVPDIIVKSENKDLFVIEVKKPGIPLNSEFGSQLKSYMRQLKLDFGILIGQKIQIFYDGILFGNSDFTLIDEIEFIRDSEKGRKFIELFNKENYSKHIIENHAQEKIEKLKEVETIKKLKEELLSENYKEKVKNYLITELLNKYSENLINQVFSELDIKIENKIVEVLNFTQKRTKEYRSVINLEDANERTGKLPIGKYVQETFKKLIIDNLIDKDEIEKLQRADYSKQTFDIQFPFLKKMFSLNSTERIRYWKNPIFIKGENYFVCSQWYEVPANNDRPYYESWLKKMENK